jgi:uncharacterized membrane protein
VAARRDWLVAAVAAAGAVVSAYLTFTKLAGSAALFCEAGSGCDIVQSSRYATFLGVPTAAWGIVLYAAVGALALVGLSARAWLAAFLLVVAGVAFSAYLTYLSLFELGAACPYCLLDAAIAVALLVALWVRRPAPVGRQNALRPGRLAVYGGLTAVAAIVFAAGVFVTGATRATSGYAADLARHLAATRAVFYGAFW